MGNVLKLTSGELGLIKLALEETITVLNNRFEKIEGFIHPAIKYEDLYDKINLWDEKQPLSMYKIKAIPV